MKHLKFSGLLIFPFLCSFTSASNDTYLPFNTNMTSYAAGKTIRACKKLYEDKSATLDIKAKNYDEVASSMTMSIGLYQIGRETLLSTETIPDYVFYYRFDVYLNNNVHYRGGFLDISDFYGSTYLQYIDMNVNFSNLTSEDTNKVSFPIKEVSSNSTSSENKNYYVIYVDPTATADFSNNDLELNKESSYKYGFQEGSSPHVPSGYKANLSTDNISEGIHMNGDGMDFSKTIVYPKTSNDGNFMSGPNPQQTIAGFPTYSKEKAYFFSIYGYIRFNHFEKEITEFKYYFGYQVIYGKDNWRSYFFSSDATPTKTVHISN